MEGQLSLFDVGEKKLIQAAGVENYPEISEYPQNVLLAMEKEMLGLYISGHPLREFEDVIESEVTFFSTDLEKAGDTAEADASGAAENNYDGLSVIIGGIITQKKTKTTKSNNLMAFLNVEDLYGNIEVIVFPTVLERYSKLISEENIVLISGRVSVKEDEASKIICEEIRPMKREKDRIKKLFLRLCNDGAGPDKSLLSLLMYFNGSTPVIIYDEKSRSKQVLERTCWVNISDSLIDELRSRLGNDKVKVV
jgi:DNA polymerase-3 subunit alpha